MGGRSDGHLSIKLRAAAVIAVVVILCFLELGSQSVQPTISVTALPGWGQDGNVEMNQIRAEVVDLYSL